MLRVSRGHEKVYLEGASTPIVKYIITTILLFLAIFSQIWLYLRYDTLNFFYRLLILVIFISLFHIAMAKPFFYLRGMKYRETMVEHFFLVAFAHIILIFFDFYLFKAIFTLDYFYAFLLSMVFIIAIMYDLSKSAFLINREFYLPIDILALIVGIGLSYALLPILATWLIVLICVGSYLFMVLSWVLGV